MKDGLHLNQEDHISFTLSDLLEYDPATGALTWKHRPIALFGGPNPEAAWKTWNTRYAGAPAFGKPTPNGYRSAMILGRRVMAHRAAWVLHTGKPIPHGVQIDHINGNRSDNRIGNLRLCTPAQNMYNAKKKTVDGLRGAFYHKQSGRYQSSIRVQLGSFETAEEAAAAYERAAKILHRDFYLINGVREDPPSDE